MLATYRLTEGLVNGHERQQMPPETGACIMTMPPQAADASKDRVPGSWTAQPCNYPWNDLQRVHLFSLSTSMTLELTAMYIHLRSQQEAWYHARTHDSKKAGKETTTMTLQCDIEGCTFGLDEHPNTTVVQMFLHLILLFQNPMTLKTEEGDRVTLMCKKAGFTYATYEAPYGASM